MFSALSIILICLIGYDERHVLNINALPIIYACLCTQITWTFPFLDWTDLQPSSQKSNVLSTELPVFPRMLELRAGWLNEGCGKCELAAWNLQPSSHKSKALPKGELPGFPRMLADWIKDVDSDDKSNVLPTDLPIFPRMLELRAGWLNEGCGKCELAAWKLKGHPSGSWVRYVQSEWKLMMVTLKKLSISLFFL